MNSRKLFEIITFFYININILLATETTSLLQTRVEAINESSLFIQNYYNLLANSIDNSTRLSSHGSDVADGGDKLRRIIGRHEALQSIEIKNFEEYFPNNSLNLISYCTVYNNYLKDLKVLDLGRNRLKNITLARNNFCKFQNLTYLDLSFNELTSLSQKQMNIFKMNEDQVDDDFIRINIQVLKLDHNSLRFIRYNTFKNFFNLTYLDLSHNQLKYLHPLSVPPSAQLLDLSYNSIQEIYRQNYENLKYFYLNSDNITLKCDCFLLDLFSKYKANEIHLDEFKCTNVSFKRTIEFKNLNYDDLNDDCNNYNVSISYKVEHSLKKSTSYSYLAKLAHRWFTWYILPENTVTDVLPKIPMLIDNYDNFTHVDVVNLVANRLTNINITCESDELNSFVIWKTPFGYFVREENLAMFHMMSNLTRVTKLLELETGPGRFSGANTMNKIFVNEKNELIVTNFRQIYTGDYTCIVLNSLNYDQIKFNINGRAGVSDHFLYCLAVSLVCSTVTSIVGIVFCLICEKQALDSFPMTPPVFPTPLDTVPTTPPNFDFNQWMTNTASNIQGTLDQASKKLRKGLEKATVTVKSIGVTSTAYFYSVYEQSTQRLHTIKSYKLPTLPTVSLPTMKYSNQLATRMGRLRTGVADVFLQFREFCGSSDLTHTASIATIESDTNASNAVGYIVGKISHMESGMNFIAEEGNINETQGAESIDTISVYVGDKK